MPIVCGTLIVRSKLIQLRPGWSTYHPGHLMMVWDCSNFSHLLPHLDRFSLGENGADLPDSKG